MKLIMIVSLITLVACTSHKNEPTHISRKVASEDVENYVCRIEAVPNYSTFYNVYNGDVLTRSGANFKEATETVQSLLEMSQCDQPEPVPKCILSAKKGYSTLSNLKTKDYSILMGVSNKESILYLNRLIELGLCEGKPLNLEELPEEAKRPQEAKKKDENIVLIGDKKYKVASFWGEKTDYSRGIFPPCFSAQSEAKAAAIGVCMAAGFPKNSCKVVEVTTLDKGSAFFSLSRDIKTFCSKHVLVEGKVVLHT